MPTYISLPPLLAIGDAQPQPLGIVMGQGKWREEAEVQVAVEGRFDLSSESRPGIKKKALQALWKDTWAQGLSEVRGHFTARLQLVWKGNLEPGRFSSPTLIVVAHGRMLLLNLFPLPLLFQDHPLS